MENKELSFEQGKGFIKIPKKREKDSDDLTDKDIKLYSQLFSILQRRIDNMTEEEYQEYKRKKGLI